MKKKNLGPQKTFEVAGLRLNGCTSVVLRMVVLMCSYIKMCESCKKRCGSVFNRNTIILRFVCLVVAKKNNIPQMVVWVVIYHGGKSKITLNKSKKLGFQEALHCETHIEEPNKLRLFASSPTQHLFTPITWDPRDWYFAYACIDPIWSMESCHYRKHAQLPSRKTITNPTGLGNRVPEHQSSTPKLPTRFVGEDCLAKWNDNSPT